MYVQHSSQHPKRGRAPDSQSRRRDCPDVTATVATDFLLCDTKIPLLLGWKAKTPTIENPRLRTALPRTTHHSVFLAGNAPGRRRRRRHERWSPALASGSLSLLGDGPVASSTRLHSVAVDTRGVRGRKSPLPGLLAAVEVDVFEVEGVQVAGQDAAARTVSSAPGREKGRGETARHQPLTPGA